MVEKDFVKIIENIRDKREVKGLLSQAGFNELLKDGEVFERFVCEELNKLPDVEAVKLEWDSVGFHVYHQVDILVKYQGNPVFCIECKLLTRTFQKSMEMFKIPTNKCLCLDKVALERYSRNIIPTFVLIYVNQAASESAPVPTGYYFKECDKIEGKIYKPWGRSGARSVKLNFDCSQMDYFASIQDLPKVIKRHINNDN